MKLLDDQPNLKFSEFENIIFATIQKYLIKSTQRFYKDARSEFMHHFIHFEMQAPFTHEYIVVCPFRI